MGVRGSRCWKGDNGGQKSLRGKNTDHRAYSGAEDFSDFIERMRQAFLDQRQSNLAIDANQEAI